MWMGGGWKVDGRCEVDWRWIRGGCSECVWILYGHIMSKQFRQCREHDARTQRKSKNLPSRGIPGRSLPQPSTNLAQPCLSSVF